MGESQQVQLPCFLARVLIISIPCSDFGSIFNELLPGNFAKLQPSDSEGQDLTQGLEVKVRLGSVWKQSLTELSGGQRYVSGVQCSDAMLNVQSV